MSTAENVQHVEALEPVCNECGGPMVVNAWGRVDHAGGACPGGPDIGRWQDYVEDALRDGDTDCAIDHAKGIALIERVPFEADDTTIARATADVLAEIAKDALRKANA